jgi:hypothetical protein
MVYILGSFNESIVTFKAWWLVYNLLILSIKKLHFVDSVFMFHITFRTRIYFRKWVIVFLYNGDYIYCELKLVLNI